MARMPKLVSKSFATPKGCHVRFIEMRPGGEALIGYDCGNAGAGMNYDTPDGGRSNYPKALVKNARSVRLPGSSVSLYPANPGDKDAKAAVSFTLSPRHATCRKTASSSEIACTIHEPDGRSLSGPRRRRRK